MQLLFFDTETFSECDLKAHGTHRYASDPSTEITVAQWALGDEEPLVCDCTDPRPHLMPAPLVRLLEDPTILIVAHNSVFDRTLVRHCWGIDIPPERWLDTMIQGMSHGLPGGLDRIGQAIGIDEDKAKDKRGKELIRLFCMPRPKGQILRRATRETHPQEWAEFLQYSYQDIVAMREVHRLLPKWNYRPGHVELALWHLDQKINDRGFAVDVELAEAAVAAVAVEQARLKAETIEASDGCVSGPSKRDELLVYLLAEYGVDLPDMKADTLRRRLEDPELPDGVKLLLSLRLESTKTSTAKYKALLKAVSADGRLRNTLQFAGAQRTARWAGRIFQPQNMTRPDMEADAIEFGIGQLKAGTATVFFDDVMRLASNAVRGCIVAPPFKKLCIADLSNIEGRGLAYLAGENWKIKAFAEFDRGIGADLYKLAYARSFNVSPEDVDKKRRQIGKVQELGLGYEGGVAAFITFAAVYQMDLDELADAVWATASTEAIENAAGMLAWVKSKRRSTYGLTDRVYIACELLKRAWRDAHPCTEALWTAAKEGVTSAICNPGQQFSIGRHLVARRDGAWLRLRLPSGRYLCYLHPEVDESGQISYMGVSQYTRQWTRLKTYGGKIIENCLAGATLVLTERGPMPLRDITLERVWDGVEWVSHKGLKYSGKQTTMQAFGVGMTPDHRVLTTKGWRRASSCEGLDRADCRLPNSLPVPRERREEVSVGGGVRLWKNSGAAGHGAAETESPRNPGVLRLHEGRFAAPGADDPRDVEAPGIRRVALDAGQVPATLTSRLERLRGAGYRGLRKLAAVLRELLAGYGADLRSGADAGAARQQRRVQPDELRLGDAQSPGEQHPQISVAGHPGRTDDRGAGGRALRGEIHDAAVAPGCQVASGPGLEPVFDLVDCGPRNRFVVFGDDLEPLIVHNCTQAFARDIMAYNMPAIDAAGYEIVLTVHDELLTETPDDPSFSSDELAGMMANVPPWAAGIPLAAAGFSCYRYRKE